MGVIVAMASMVILLIASALISGSEVAFFSLSPADKQTLESSKSKSSRLVLKLLSLPQQLLATILVANNLVNVGIVILSTYITISIFNLTTSPILAFLIQIVTVTFLLLFFGEILPKVYANKRAYSFSKFMSGPLIFLSILLKPISKLLVRTTGFVHKHFGSRKPNLSMEDLSQALELASDDIPEDRNILKGIVKFGFIEAREIMQSRVDVTAADINIAYQELMQMVFESGYSRIPVYENSIDNIKGILYIKDLLPFLDNHETPNWQSLLRPPFYVPENKKISDLLSEFQSNKTHLAIVIDEYGGTSGLITMEDILEEIVGEISDESDDDEKPYRFIDDNNYIFEGKVLLNDFYKVLHIKDTIFDEIKGDADTLAGLLLELRGEIPELNDQISYKNFIFKVKAVDQRRIKLIHVTIVRKEEIVEE
jgi:gliding motility-associated protein GldE